MHRHLRNLALAAASSAALLAVAGAAEAQSYNRLVVFGDSLSDNGNLYFATGNTQPPSPPYFQGRFSNGPVFTELLGFNALRGAVAASPESGSINYAYGGARTDFTAFPAGMRLQLQTYNAAGGVFGANDLVSVLGGANDLLPVLSACTTTPACAANPSGFASGVATGAAANIDALVSAIAGQGAGTILVSNLPNLGATPRARAGGADGVALATFAGSTFNSALNTRLTATAAARPNSNIIVMDLFKVINSVVANPGAYSLTNVTNQCLVGATACSTPDSYLFWDDIHPTAAGHRLVAALANDYLFYGDRGSQTAVQGETTIRQREDMLDMSTDALSGRAAWEPISGMTVGVIGTSATTDARGAIAETDVEGYGLRVGLDHAMSPNWRMGLAATFHQSDVDAGPLQFDVDTYALDAYVGWRSGDLFVNAAAGGAIDQYDDIARAPGVGAVNQFGKTDGDSAGARLQAGMWFDMGSIALSPRAAVAYLQTDVNAYAETGPAAEYNHADRTLSATTGEIALRAEGGGDNLNFWIEGGYRDTLSEDYDAVRTGLSANPAQVLSRQVDDPFGGSALLAAGVDADMFGGTISLGYRGRFGDQADSHIGGISYTLKFQ